MQAVLDVTRVLPLTECCKLKHSSIIYALLSLKNPTPENLKTCDDFASLPSGAASWTKAAARLPTLVPAE